MKLSRVLLCSIIPYVALLSLCFIASLFQEGRLWGFNGWGFLPSWAGYAFYAAGLILLLPAWLLRRDRKLDSHPSTYWLVAAVVIPIAGVSFYLLRFHTYFLGDGYTLIGLLTAKTPLIKWRNYGGTVIQALLQPLLSGTPKEAAVTAYQTVSWLAGTLFIMASAFGAYVLTPRLAERILLLLGLCTGGYALLFFGYVENYALFVVSVAVYCLIGLCIVRKPISQWWILLPQVVALFFHVFGLVLLPATAFLLLRPTAVYCRIVRRPRSQLIFLAVAVLVFGVVAFLSARSSSLTLQLASLPLVSDRFTIDNYTLFSWNHLLDFWNLLFLLCPGWILATVCWWFHRPHARGRAGEIGFLILVTLASLALAFLIDPKLGMARDWDLFAFVGVPLVFLSFLIVLRDNSSAEDRLAAILMVGLAAVVLSGRVGVGFVPEAGVRQTRAYMYLDPVRNHNSWSILVDYYLIEDDSTQALNTIKEKLVLLPEEAALVSSRQHFEQGKLQMALSELLTVKDRYRGMGAYHSQLGAIFLKLGRTAESFEELQIALTMNPYNPNNLTNLGTIYFKRGDTARAESHWRKALSVDPTSAVSLYGLTVTAGISGDMEELSTLFEKGATVAWMQVDFYMLVAKFACSKGEFELASRALEAGLERGLDSAEVARMHTAYPSLDSL